MAPATPANLRGFRLARVHGLDLVAVAFAAHHALHVLLQRELAGGLGEIVRQEREVFDRLPLAEVAVDAVDRLLNPRLYRRLIHPLPARGVPVGNDQSRDVRATIAEGDRPLNQWIAQQRMLELLRRDVLAAGGLEKRFLAVCDLQEAVAVQLADV